MKRILLPLFLLLALAGCGEKTQQRAEALQEHYAALAGYEAQVRIALPREEETLFYTLCLVKDGGAVRAEVLAPEELAGVAATLAGDALTLEYDGVSLDAGTLSPRVSALNAVPLLLNAFPQAYLDSFGSETLDGTKTLRADFSATAGAETLACALFFGEDGAPLYSEIAADGKIIAAAEFTDFIFGDILSPDA